MRADFLRAVVRGLALATIDVDPRGLQVIGGLVLERLDFNDITFPRPITFTDCTLAGGLTAERASLHALILEKTTVTRRDPLLAAVALDGAHVSHELRIFKCLVSGQVRLPNADVAGQMQVKGVTITNMSGPALDGDGMAVGSDLGLEGNFAGAGESGTVRLLGASVGGQLDCAGGFINLTGPALGADRLTTKGTVFLAGSYIGAGELGAVRLLGASIDGQLDCAGGTFTNRSGPALIADGMTTGQSAYLRGTFKGSGTAGAVRLHGAQIGGDLLCRRGTFTDPTGPALNAENLTVNGNLNLTGQFAGDGPLGAVNLRLARISGKLVCKPPGVIESKSAGALNLTGATVGWDWSLDTGIRHASTPHRWLEIDGLIYSGLPRESESEWVQVLADETVCYAAQPWQHLAAMHRAAGHEQEAKTILVAQQDDRLKRVIQPKSRARGIAYGASRRLIGYGYRASRALVWLVLWAVVGVISGVWAGNSYIETGIDGGGSSIEAVLTRKAPATVPTSLPTPCSRIEQIGLGLEWSVPILGIDASGTCQLNMTHPLGQGWTAWSWFLRTGGWALATLAVAGYTGIVRRI